MWCQKESDASDHCRGGGDGGFVRLLVAALLAVPYYKCALVSMEPHPLCFLSPLNGSYIDSVAKEKTIEEKIASKKRGKMRHNAHLRPGL